MRGIISTQNKLRAAFLSKEKAEMFLSNLEKLKEEKSTGETQYGMLKIEYTQMREEVISEINSIKNSIKQELENKVGKLEVLKQEIAYLNARFKVGQLSVDAYRAKEKGPKSKLIELEKGISDLLMLINATKSAEVGISVGGLTVLGFNLGFSKIQPPIKPLPTVSETSPEAEQKSFPVPVQGNSPIAPPSPLPPPPPPLPASLPPSPPPPPPPPPTVTTTGLQIMPGRVMEGGSVGIIVTVTNVSFGNVQHRAELKINGEINDSRDISLFPGQSEEITFVSVAGIPGDYQVDINGITGNFSVIPAENIRYLR